MNGWIEFLIYCAGYLFVYRKTYVIAVEAVSGGGSGHVEKFERGSGAIISLMVAIFWPFVLVGYLFYWVFTPKTQAEREQELQEREERLLDQQRRIRELERELGIGDTT